MSMPLGHKLIPAYLRATSGKGVVHALANDRPDVYTVAGKAVCNRIDTVADADGKRFQVGLDNTCTTCLKRVLAGKKTGKKPAQKVMVAVTGHVIEAVTAVEPQFSATPFRSNTHKGRYGRAAPMPTIRASSCSPIC